MELDIRIFAAIGDVFLNLSAGWFGAAFIVPKTFERSPKEDVLYVGMNIVLGITALAIGFKFRTL